MRPDQLEIFLQVEREMDAFVREGGVDPDIVKLSHRRSQLRPDQVEYSFQVPAGSLIATLHPHRRGGELVPAFNVEIAIAEILPGSRRAAFKWSLEANYQLEGLSRLALSGNLIVVSIGVVVTPENISFVADSLRRLPSIAESILEDLGEAVAIKPFLKQERTLHG